jgi:hypothetical protein
MAKYFNFFPKVPYFLNKEKLSIDLVTNIMSRFKFENKFKENTVVYYDYIISDGETPEMIADKFYGSSERHWIILNLNDIINPYLDWPMSENSLIKFIDKKYESFADTANNETGFEWSQSNVKQYYTRERRSVLPENKSYDTITLLTPEAYANTLVTSDNYTLNDGTEIVIDVSKETKTFYEYELDENDSKRRIKLLKKEFIFAVEDEFKKII